MAQLSLEALQKRHEELLKLNESAKISKADITQVEMFLKELAAAGAYIEDPDQRSLLRAYIHYWASFIDDKTGSFPPIQLQPFPITGLRAGGGTENVTGNLKTTVTSTSQPGQLSPIPTLKPVSQSLGYRKGPKWIGFGEYTKISTTTDLTSSPPKVISRTEEDQPAKTLWDWLTLLIIPIVLAAGALGFGAFQNQENFNLSQAQFHLAATQYANNQNIAATQYANAQQLALENTFQTYLDRMTDLLTNQHVHDNTQQGADIRSLATARTLTILPDLALPRRATVMKFLHDAGLISRQSTDPNKKNIIDPVVNLNGADFNNVDLTGFVLGGADLANVNFSGAILNGADLSSAYLMNANLSKAHLKGAAMCFAAIFGNTNLRGADLSRALLGGADLTGADLSGAILNGTNLGKNDPTCHALQPPNQTLSGATLTNAVLNGADLSNADLTGVAVTNADFTHVIWNNTTCPDGTNSGANNPSSCNVG